MPIIRIDYNNEKINKDSMVFLCNALQEIVSKITKIKDVFVYANSSEIKIKIAPIEVFIEMSAHKIENIDNLLKEIKDKIKNWKNNNNFEYKINLTIIPMNWKMEIGI